jgi:hypothetical protein
MIALYIGVVVVGTFIPKSTPAWVGWGFALVGGLLVGLSGYKLYYRKPKPPDPPDDPLPPGPLPQ